MRASHLDAVLSVNMRAGDHGGVRLSPVVVGRDELISLAGRRWQSAADRASQLLLLSGEAGVGKSRLLRELAAIAVGAVGAVGAAGAGEGGGVAVIAATSPSDADVAGGVLLDLALRARQSGDPAVVATGEVITSRLRAGDEDGDPDRRRRLLVADLAEAVLALGAGPTPVLAAIEDLQWADELTLEVLTRVAQHLEGRRLLLVGTYRSDELLPRLALRGWRVRLLNQRLAEEVRLRRLSREQTDELCTAITGTVLPAALVDQIYARSDGIPLHVEELLATAADPTTVPDTLAEAVLARAAQLSPAARSLADLASVLGRSFALDLLLAAGDASASTMDDGLTELTERSIVVARPDGVSWDFRHALIRDALYAALPPNHRRQLHRRVAEAAQAAGWPDAFLSDQFERAGRPADAYQHARAAAHAATAVSAHREAVALLRRAQRTTPGSTGEAERAALLVELAEALAATDDNTAAALLYSEAHALLTRAGDEVGAAAIVPGWVAVRHLLGADLAERTGQLRATLDRVTEPAVRLPLLAALAAAHMLSRQLDESITYGEAATALAEGDVAAAINVEATLGSVLVFAGRMAEGWARLEAAVERAVAGQAEAEAARAYRMLGSSASVLVEYVRGEAWLRAGIAYAERTERWNDRHYMAAHLAHVHWATGDWDTAFAEARRAMADGGGGITTRITALHVLGYVALGRGSAEEARARLDEARQLGEQMNELQRLSPALWGLAELSVHDGQFADAAAWCERGYAASAAVFDAAYLFPYVVTGVRAHLGRNDLSAARSWFARVTELVRRRDIPGTLPALDHARGLLLQAEGQGAKARDALTAAETGWAALRRHWELHWVRLDLARSYQRSRRAAEASALAAAVRAEGTALGARPWLRVADALRRGAAPVGPLTVREHEVARLIAGGATNREIAAALHIAPKTVAAHVEHILTKLGVSRRAEIAVWAATRT